MDKEWIAFIGTLTGVIIGSAISYFIKKFEFSYQTRREDKKLLLQKLEEFHELLCEYIFECSTFSSNIIKLGDSKSLFSSRKNLIKDFIQINETFVRKIPKIHSMQRIYSPELKIQWTELLTNVEQLCIAGKVYAAGEEKDFDKLISKSSAVQKVCYEILEAVEIKIQNQIEAELKSGKTLPGSELYDK